MRNYVEKTYFCGMIKLRQYDRIDLFWGKFKNVERDFLRAHAFIFIITILIIGYIAA